MQKLNQKATGVFLNLVKDLNEVGDSQKIANSDAFMPVCVEIIGQPDSESIRGGWIVSVAHYYDQSGDLVCDPDVTFLLANGNVFPMTFEQGGMTYQVAAKFDDGRLLFDSRKQRDLATFCNQWMNNIAEQQDMET